MNIAATTRLIQAATADLKLDNDIADARDRAAFIGQQIAANTAKRIPLIATFNRTELEAAQLAALNEEHAGLKANLQAANTELARLRSLQAPACVRAPAKPFDLSRSMGYGTGRYQGD